MSQRLTIPTTCIAPSVAVETIDIRWRDNLFVSFRQYVMLRSNYGGLKSEDVEDFGQKKTFFWKNNSLQVNVQNSVPNRFIEISVDLLCSNFVKFGRPEIGRLSRVLLT